MHMAKRNPFSRRKFISNSIIGALGTQINPSSFFIESASINPNATIKGTVYGGSDLFIPIRKYSC